MVFSNVINTFASRSADLIIGKSLGPGPLGLFNLAHEISNLPSTELSAPVNRAVYPGYAKVASDPSRLAAQFLDVLGLTALLTTPAAVGIAAVAPLLVPLLLGDAWAEAVPLMEILALSGLLVSLRTNAGYVFLALGRSELLTVMTAVRFAIAVPRWSSEPSISVPKARLDDPRNIHRDAPGYAFLHAPGSSHPLAEDASVLWRPAIAAFGMALLVREYLEWTEHDLTTSHAVPALASAVVLGIAVYIY